MKFTCPFTPAVLAIAGAIRSLPTFFGSPALVLDLFENDPAIGPNTGIADLTVFDGGGVPTISAGADETLLKIDAATGKLVLIMPSPEGGWIFKTANATNLPKLAYGVMLTNDEPNLVGVAKFPNPIMVSANGQAVFAGDLTFEFPASPLE